MIDIDYQAKPDDILHATCFEFEIKLDDEAYRELQRQRVEREALRKEITNAE